MSKRIGLLLLLHLISYNLKSQQLSSAYLEYGSNASGSNYLVVAQDQDTRNDDKEQFRLTQDKKTKRLLVDRARCLSVYYKDVGYPLYVFPGDSLTVDCNENGCFFKGSRENEWNLSRTLINKSYPFFGINYWDFGSVALQMLTE